MEAKEVTSLTDTERLAVLDALGLNDASTDDNHFWSAAAIMANLSTNIKNMARTVLFQSSSRIYYLIANFTAPIRVKGSVGYGLNLSKGTFDIEVGAVIKGNSYFIDTAFGLALYKETDGTYSLYAYGYDWGQICYSCSLNYTPVQQTPTGTLVTTLNSSNNLVADSVTSILSTNIKTYSASLSSVSVTTAITGGYRTSTISTSVAYSSDYMYFIHNANLTNLLQITINETTSAETGKIAIVVKSPVAINLDTLDMQILAIKK